MIGEREGLGGEKSEEVKNGKDKANPKILKP